jgi:transposase
MITVNDGIFAGIDTHRDTYAIATCDTFGTSLKTAEFKTTKKGISSLLTWLQKQGDVSAVGVECTGSYGKGVTASLQKIGINVLEVTSPVKKERRSKGKNDEMDAISAARTARDYVYGGTREANACVSKDRTSEIEQIRVVKTAYDSAKKMKTQTINAFKAAIIDAPEELRDSLRGLSTLIQVKKCARMHPEAGKMETFYSKTVLKREALRVLQLDEEIKDYKKLLDEFANTHLKNLMKCQQIGSVSAVQFFLSSGANIERFENEAHFAAHCGVSPVPASSGLHSHMRLSRAGDRKANSALYMIAIGRMGKDNRTKAYVEKKISEGKTKKDAIRCLKRYIAREVFRALKKDLEIFCN